MLPIGLMYDFIDGELNAEKIMQEVVLEPVIRQRKEALNDLADKIVSMREREANEKMAEMAALLDDIQAEDPYAAARPQIEILQRSITRSREVCRENSDSLEAAGKLLIEKNRQQHMRMAELKQLQQTLKIAHKNNQLSTFLNEANDRVCDHIGRSNANK